MVDCVNILCASMASCVLSLSICGTLFEPAAVVLKCVYFCAFAGVDAVLVYGCFAATCCCY